MTRPLIDYLTKDYEGFRQLMLDRLSTTLPDWQERHASDLGITLVEVLAYAADHLSYYQDAASTEAYMRTARQRISIRRHGKLIDYTLHEGCNSRVFVHLQVSAASKTLALADIEFLAIDTREQPVPSQSSHHSNALTNEAVNLSTEAYEAFAPVCQGKVRFTNACNTIAFGEVEAGARSVDIILPGSASLDRGYVLILTNPKVGLSHPVMLSEQPHLLSSGETRLIWAAEDALPEELAGNIVALGNIVLADHGVWRQRRVTVAAGSVRPLPPVAVTHAEAVPALGWNSASAMLRQDPRAALAQIELRHVPTKAEPSSRIDRHQPHAAEIKADLLSSNAWDRHFCAEFDDDGRAHLRFGDGVCGARPLDGERTLRYRVGNGPAGNVRAGRINSIRRVSTRKALSSLAVTVSNPMAAQGGIERESARTAQLLAPASIIYRQSRAVSAADYVVFADKVACVRKSAATIVKHGIRHVVTVAVDARAQERPGPDDWANARDEVAARLEGVRCINHDVVVIQPIRVAMDVQVGITVHAGEPTIVAKQVRDLLLLQFFGDDARTLGQPVYWSQIAAAASRIGGVSNVIQDAFRRVDDRVPTMPSLDIQSIEIGPLEIGVLDNPALLVRAHD